MNYLFRIIPLIFACGFRWTCWLGKLRKNLAWQLKYLWTIPLFFRTFLVISFEVVTFIISCAKKLTGFQSTQPTSPLVLLCFVESFTLIKILSALLSRQPPRLRLTVATIGWKCLWRIIVYIFYWYIFLFAEFFSKYTLTHNQHQISEE